jgi:hypothetical protein
MRLRPKVVANVFCIRIRKSICKPPEAMNLYRTRLGPRDLTTYKEGPGEAGQGDIEIWLVMIRFVLIISQVLPCLSDPLPSSSSDAPLPLH